jgi:hypothetical protein
VANVRPSRVATTSTRIEGAFAFLLHRVVYDEIPRAVLVTVAKSAQGQSYGGSVGRQQTGLPERVAGIRPED